MVSIEDSGDTQKILKTASKLFVHGGSMSIAACEGYFLAITEEKHAVGYVAGIRAVPEI